MADITSKTPANTSEKNIYPKDSAGRLMVRSVPTGSASTTVGDVERDLIKHTKEFESINYVYVLDSQKKLAGVISIKEIFDQDNHIHLSDIMRTDVVTVRAHTDQERVAYQALKHNIKALPVIDKNGVFLGVVPSDHILRTLHEEASEDMSRFAGVYSNGGSTKMDDVMNVSVWRALMHRLPWLLVGLLGGLVTAGIITHFDAMLSEYLVLASFIPLVVYMAGATSMQMTIIMVRDYALHPRIPFLQYFLKQLATVLLIATISGALLFVVGYFLVDAGELRMVLGAALFATIISSVFSGLLVPHLFLTLGYDPANASGPIATTIQDLTSIIIYFSIATLLL